MVVSGMKNIKGVKLETNKHFMNDSGRDVFKLLNYYHAEPKDLLVIHDDLDLPLGEVRLQTSRSSAGHKGVQSIIDHLGTQDFGRIRIGIGRPEKGEVEDWVLEPFSSSEKEAIKKAIEQSRDLITLWLKDS